MNQELRDNHNNRIGVIKDEGSKQVIYDKHNNRLGYFDGKYTYDKHNNRVGQGNLLATLLPR